jgi:hypothetical protein
MHKGDLAGPVPIDIRSDATRSPGDTERVPHIASGALRNEPPIGCHMLMNLYRLLNRDSAYVGCATLRAGLRHGTPPQNGDAEPTDG